MRPKMLKKTHAFFPSANANVRAKIWYTDCPMGINRIAEMLPRICKKAGLGDHFTNHSLRCTMRSQLLNSGKFDLVTVLQLTSHKDPNSLKHYYTAILDTQKAMNDVLQGIIPNER